MHRHRLTTVETALIYSTILIALYLCAPGFLPKELKYDLFGLFTTPRGHGFLYFTALAGCLLPVSFRLRKEGFASTVTGALFFLFSALMLLQYVLDVACRSHTLAVWVLRALFLGGLFYCRKSLPDLWLSLRNFKSMLSKAAWHEKTLLGLCFFFLIRQTLAFFYNRGAPFQDEVNFWHTAALDFTKGGFAYVIQQHSYTLAVPWLAALPATIFGSLNPESVYAYSSFIFFGMILLSIELSKNPRALLAGLGTLLLCFSIQRDLFALYAASLYGEATAALVCAVLVAELLSVYREKDPSTRALIGFFGIAAYACVTKPPLANLAWGVPVLFLFKKMDWHKRVLALSVGVLYLPWRLHLYLLHKSTYYAMYKTSDALARGIKLSVPWIMVRGLLNRGTPQSGFTTALIIVAFLALLHKNFRALGIFAMIIAFYWGFVFTLYATLWQDGEMLSAGRYISHAAVACVILLPLAFSKRQSHA